MLLHAALPPPPPAPPARALVYADEFRFGVSRAWAPAGRLRVQVSNIGEDDHDLRILGPRGGARASSGRVAPGGLATVRVRLGRGVYRLVCTLPDHAERGMRATLVIRSRAR